MKLTRNKLDVVSRNDLTSFFFLPTRHSNLISCLSFFVKKIKLVFREELIGRPNHTTKPNKKKDKVSNFNKIKEKQALLFLVGIFQSL